MDFRLTAEVAVGEVVRNEFEVAVEGELLVAEAKVENAGDNKM